MSKDKLEKCNEVRDVSTITSILQGVPGGPPSNSVNETFSQKVQDFTTKSTAESAVAADKST